MVLVAGVAIVAFASPGSHAAPVSAAQAAAEAQQDQPAVALQVLSVTPAAGAKGVNGADPIRVQFSAPLAANTPMPTLSPHIAGSWQVEGDTAVFTPAVGYSQNSKVKLTIPGGPNGMISVDGASAGSGGPAGLHRDRELHHRLVQHPAPAGAAQPAGLPAADLDPEAQDRRDQPQQRQRRAVRRVSGARGDVQLGTAATRRS